MLFTIGFKESNSEFNLQVQKSLNIIFTTMSSFFVASMIAYLLSKKKTVISDRTSLSAINPPSSYTKYIVSEIED